MASKGKKLYTRRSCNIFSISASFFWASKSLLIHSYKIRKIKQSEYKKKKKTPRPID